MRVFIASHVADGCYWLGIGLVGVGVSRLSITALYFYAGLIAVLVGVSVDRALRRS